MPGTRQRQSHPVVASIGRYAVQAAPQKAGKHGQPRMQRCSEPMQTVISVIAKTRMSWELFSEQYLSPDSVIGVGHGYAALTRDGVPVFEENGQEFEQLMTVAQAESLAREDPLHDWKIHLVALLDDRHYQRDDEGNWVLVRRGYGLS